MANAPTGGVAAGLQQPQTTVEPAGGPFIRHSQPGRRAQYNVTGQSFTSGNIVTQPLVSAPGYYRNFRVTAAVTATTNLTSNTTLMSADYPYNLFSLVTLKDAFGTPLIVAPGFEAFKLIPLYSGQYGAQFGSRDVANMPSYSAVDAPSAGSTKATSGNFSFSSCLPLEFTKGYGVISGANASLLPTLTFNVNASSVVYSTAPSTVGTFSVAVDSDFYWLPEGVAVEPPGLGTTQQWVYQQANPTIGSAATTTVQFPRLGGYLSMIILEMRDSTGARIDAWPTGNNRIRIYVDGVPLIDSTYNEILDDMFITMGIGGTQSGGVTRPTGTLAISRKTSLAQTDFGLFDTGESFLSTNPGTLIEVQGSPWGSITNAPATLSVLVGQVVPSGQLIQGLPEL